MKKILIAAIVIAISSCKKELRDNHTNDAIHHNTNSPTQSNVAYGDDFPTRAIALTYDDGPDVNSINLANYLYDNKVCATFFVTCNITTGDPSKPGGIAVSQYQSNIHYYLTHGLLVGNHTYSHQDISSGILSPITDCQNIINQQINTMMGYTDNCYMFRAPYGSFPINKPEISKIDGTPVYPYFIAWNHHQLQASNGAWLVVGDYRFPQTTSAVSLADSMFLIAEQIRTKDHGGILLMHDRNENAVGSTYALDETKRLVPRLKAAGYVFVPPVLRFSDEQSFSTDFSDASGFGNDIGYYGTFRLADVNNDGLADECARGPEGIWVALANKHGFNPKTLWKSNDFTDALGWKPQQYSTTLQFGDVTGDGKLDLIIRGPNGLVIAHNTGSGFGYSQLWSPLKTGSTTIREYSDADGWGSDIGYYGTIRVADVNNDGRADICARGENGIVVSLSEGDGFSKRSIWQSHDFTDAQGWKPAQYSTTIQLGDVTGDGRPDVVARGFGGLRVAINTGSGFGDAEYWSSYTNGILDYSDADGWGSDVSYYGTIRLADVNGDGIADVCGRGAWGEGVSFGSPVIHAFLEKRNILWTPYFFDSQGWNNPKYSLTMQLADINGDGRADIVSRGPNGLSGGFFP